VIVDAHVHVFRPADVSPRGVDALAPARRDAPVEDLLAVMAEHRVGAAVMPTLLTA
jgi:L-fuconolactonase